jgi:hypothetical protein
MDLLGSHWTDFHEISYFRISRKYVEKIKVPLKSNNNSGYFARRFMDYFLKLKMLQTELVMKIETHVLCSDIFPKKNRAAYEIMWKNMVETDKTEMTI